MKKMSKFGLLSIILFLSVCSGRQDPGPGNILQAPVTNLAGVVEDEFNGQAYVVYVNSTYQVMVAYSKTTLAGKTLNFQEADSPFPNVFIDDEGTVWDVFGKAVSGPGEGDQLLPVSYQVGYWFSFATFFPKVTLFGEARNERFITGFGNKDWLIDPNEVKQGAARDGIPAIGNPAYYEVDIFNEGTGPYHDSELMVVLEGSNTVKVYPHAILNWHEIVNLTETGQNLVLSYCPLTGTSLVWERDYPGHNGLDFGVSGLLYNNNLILYDRDTESLWSQILSKVVFGPLKGTRAKPHPFIEMNWKGVKKLHRQTFLLSENTGYVRNYSQYPYGDYRVNENLLFPVTYTDDRLHPKERVLAVIINEEAKVYQFEDFGN